MLFCKKRKKLSEGVKMNGERKEEGYASSLLTCITLRVFFGILIVLLRINYFSLLLSVLGYGKR